MSRTVYFPLADFATLIWKYGVLQIRLLQNFLQLSPFVAYSVESLSMKGSITGEKLLSNRHRSGSVRSDVRTFGCLGAGGRQLGFGPVS